MGIIIRRFVDIIVDALNVTIFKKIIRFPKI